MPRSATRPRRAVMLELVPGRAAFIGRRSRTIRYWQVQNSARASTEAEGDDAVGFVRLRLGTSHCVRRTVPPVFIFLLRRWAGGAAWPTVRLAGVVIARMRLCMGRSASERAMRPELARGRGAVLRSAPRATSETACRWRQMGLPTGTHVRRPVSSCSRAYALTRKSALDEDAITPGSLKRLVRAFGSPYGDLQRGSTCLQCRRRRRSTSAS